MSKQAILLTDRAAFEQSWRGVLERAGLHVQVVAPDGAESALREGTAAVIDAGCELFDEDELLAHVGLARALRVPCSVALPDEERFASIDELLEDLCPGLVLRAGAVDAAPTLRNGADLERVAAALARRLDRDRARRFEYLAVSPRPSELLAILADGTALLIARPLGDDDDGSDVSSIALGAAAESAVVALASGRELSLRAPSFGASHSNRPSAPPINGNHGPVAIDGVRLGARLRELRVAAGLTQAELARRTGIHRPNIARVEAGRHTPSLETLARLASAIGVPTTTVLAEE
jgi:DNA-binding XRE family transcriptional regulator